MLIVGHELSVTFFTLMVLLSVVGLTILNYLTACAAGADEHDLEVWSLTS